MARLRSMDEVLADMVRATHESGELRHLYGKPLDIDDDPDWMVNAVLKRAGAGHPTLELRNEIDRMRGDAEETINDLAARYERQVQRRESLTNRDIQAFNRYRDDVLRRYEELLRAYNRRAEGFNMTNVEAVRLPWVAVAASGAAAQRRVPAIELHDEDSARPRGSWSRLTHGW